MLRLELLMLGKTFKHWGVSALCTVCAGVWAGPARCEQADPTGKGIAGGILLGAELAVFGEAIGGLERPWLYWAGAGAGAALGGVGGYYLESNASPNLSFYALLAGMALTIPGAIVYLDATAMSAHAPTPVEEDGPNYDEEPPLLSQTSDLLERRLTSHRSAGSLVNITPKRWRLSPPNVELSSVFKRTELAQFGGTNATRWLLPLVGGTF